MRKLKLLFLLCLLISFQACKKNGNDSNITNDVQYEFVQGVYCADVTYYNPKTGTRNTYSLNVEVENHKITVIHWPNGGWLDDSHFSPQELDPSGSCSFTSDQGHQYDIQIRGPECSFTDENKMSNDLKNDRNAVTCPNCGGDKETYENYCNSCIELAKNACPECGIQKSNYTDLCDYCYKKNHTCLMCGKLKEVLSTEKKFCPDCVRICEKFEEQK